LGIHGGINNKFTKMYNKIPHDIKPSQPIAKVNCARNLEDDISMMLRERRFATITIMKYDSIDIDGKLTS